MRHYRLAYSGVSVLGAGPAGAGGGGAQNIVHCSLELAPDPPALPLAPTVPTLTAPPPDPVLVEQATTHSPGCRTGDISAE